MTTASPEIYTYREGDEGRVLAAIAAEPGISNAGLSEELGIAPDALKELTAVLRKERRAAFRSLPDEDGDLVVGWYPVPYEPGKLSAAPIPTPEPSREADELPESPIRPDKEGRTKCQYCGDEKETNVKRAGHERFCRQNPNRELAPGERKKATIRSKRSADDVRSCPVAGCPSKFKGVHSRKSLINHMVRLHDIDLADAKLIADGKLSPPAVDAPDPAVDADIIPPSEVECEGCDQLHGGECAEDEECVANCDKKMEQLQADAPVELEHFESWDGPRVRIKGEAERVAAAERPECDGDTCRIGPLPPAEEFISDVRGAIDKCGGSLPWWDSYPGPRVLRFPDRAEYEEYLTRPPLPWTDLTVEQAYLDTFERKVREDLPLPRPAPGPCEPLNTCTPIDVQHVTIRTTERPEDEPTPLARICSLAVEMEALAARHGYTARVDIDAYDERPKMQLTVRPKGVD